MTWADFRWAFKIKYILVDVMYMKAKKFLHHKQKNMLLREFSTKLNSLAKYALGVTDSDKGKLE